MIFCRKTSISGDKILTTGHFRVRVLSQVRIKYGITDLITHFICEHKVRHVKGKNRDRGLYTLLYIMFFNTERLLTKITFQNLLNVIQSFICKR